MISRKILYLFSFTIFLLWGCEKDEKPMVGINPEITPTEEISKVEPASADSEDESVDDEISDDESADDSTDEITLSLSTPTSVLVESMNSLDLESSGDVEELLDLVVQIENSEDPLTIIEALEKEAEKDPDNIQILYTLSQFYNRAGKVAAEYSSIKRIEEAERRGVRIPSTLSFLYGRAEQIQGDQSRIMDIAGLMSDIDSLIREKKWLEARNMLMKAKEDLQLSWYTDRQTAVRKGIVEDTGLKITSQPSGAEVYIDNRLRGKTPLELYGFDTGKKNIRVELEGFHSETTEMELVELDLISRNIPLREIYFIDQVLIEGGSFDMGSLNGGASEAPVHRVNLSSFYMGIYEVSQLLWTRVMGGDNPSIHQGDTLPMDNVTWKEAILFCNRLSESWNLEPCYTIQGDNVLLNLEAKGYRLPTEAEWEYAARGGKNLLHDQYPGDDLNALGWYKNNSNGKPHSVGEKEPNALGVYDMGGNVWEWCWDQYGLYSSEEQNNPSGPANDGSSPKVIRGGDWENGETYLRVSSRFLNSPAAKNGNLGFRVVRNAQ